MITMKDVDEVLELDPDQRPRLDWSDFVPEYFSATKEKDLRILEAFPEIPTEALIFSRYDWKAHPLQLKRLKKFLINSKNINRFLFYSITPWSAISKSLNQNTNITHLHFKPEFFCGFNAATDGKTFNKFIKLLKRINHIRILGLWYVPMTDNLFFSILEACTKMGSFEEFHLFGYLPRALSEDYKLDKKAYKWPEKMQQIQDLLAKSPGLKIIKAFRSHFTGKDWSLFTNMMKNKIHVLHMAEAGIHFKSKTHLKNFVTAIECSMTLNDLHLDGALSSKSIIKIMQNKNIKKLSIHAQESNWIEQSLPKNNSLESLRLTFYHRNIATDIFKALIHNTTLRSLSLNRIEMDLFGFGDLLKKNSTITSYELDVDAALTIRTKLEAEAIVEGLHSNRTIKTLKASLRGFEELIFRAVANHPSLTTFDNGRSDKDLHNIIIEMDSKNLMFLYWREPCAGKVGEILRRNRRLNRVDRQNTILGIIVLSRSLVFDIFPLEIWYKIFTEVTTGLAIDFVPLLQNK